MRILVVGAGGIGGYYGGRLLEAGRDASFLVRPRRAAKLAANGLAIRSPSGDAHLPAPDALTADALAGRGPFDLVIVTCKAYDLPGAIEDFAPAVGPGTVILPTLNGMRHLDALDARFGRDAVLGGLCLISTRLDDDGGIVHLSDVHRLTFGARSPAQAEAVRRVAEAFEGAKFEPVPSDDATLAMWEKWAFLATLAGITCLMRAAIGDVVKAGGADLVHALLDECRAIAEANGRAPRPAFLEMSRTRLTDPSSTLTASMLDDLERGGPTEADHILGDLLRRAPAAPPPTSLLRAAFTAIRAQEHRAGR
ncbi:ketopantoate reductase family protein [Paludisphaera soli]|uniref:ketopantoate reductase family protein n=1 Tax=Paludisphaera soli TaxID=2712865 RepID=UPI0013EAC7D4|nr:ketopantoate reductase family protein [Paludisphaera soli]